MMTPRTFWTTLLCASVVALETAALSGCEETRAACRVVKYADKACVTFVTADGREVQLQPQDLEAAAAMAAARASASASAAPPSK